MPARAGTQARRRESRSLKYLWPYRGHCGDLRSTTGWLRPCPDRIAPERLVLAVADAAGIPVAEGQTGELIIGGIGLARYLDPLKDAERYAPLPTLGWGRAYRSGDLVISDPERLIFAGRADEQIKLAGRRIELGEIDAALQALPDVEGAAAAVKQTPAGSDILVGYIASSTANPEDRISEWERALRAQLPAALVPRLTLIDELPTKTSGKVDRNALPSPMGDPADAEDSS